MKSKIIIFTALIFSFLLWSCEDGPGPGENKYLVSNYNENESHEKGRNCMDCHYTVGRGEGWFTLAGSAYGNTNGADVLLYQDSTADPIKIVSFDVQGNVYSTEAIDFSAGLYVAIRNRNGIIKRKKDPIFNGQCNLCHGTGVQGELTIE